MRRIIQGLVALAAFGVPTSAVGDDLEDFTIAPADFVASVSQGAIAVRGHRLFVAGVGTTLDPTSRDAMIVAVDTRRATEVWRAIAGAVALHDARRRSRGRAVRGNVVHADEGVRADLGVGADGATPDASFFSSIRPRSRPSSTQTASRLCS